MATPITGIPTPTYSPDAWTVIAEMAAALEALGISAFASEAARDAAIPDPDEGRVCYVVTLGVCVYTGPPLGWRYLAWAS